MPLTSSAGRCDLPFQSAPGREAGRCPLVVVFAAFTPLFQSAPGREAGRCPTRRLRCRPRWCFNPRPAVRPGDARVGEAEHGGVHVSIRARP